MLEPLESRRLLAVTYSLVELTIQPNDLNNLDQIAAADNVYQVRKGGRITSTPLPKRSSNGSVVATHVADDGTLIGVETAPPLGLVNPTGSRDPVAITRDADGAYHTRSLRTPVANPVDATNLVAVDAHGEILTDGAGVVTDELLYTLGARGRVSSTNLNGILPAAETLRLGLPADLNDQGQVVGAGGANSVDVLYQFRRGRASITPATALADDAVSDVQTLTAINDTGQIVGTTALAASGRATEATLYQVSSRGHYYRNFLGFLPSHTDSFATAVNSAGQVVGVSFAQPQFGPITDQAAFLVNPARHPVMQDLNALITNPGNDHVTRPIAINDAGLIIADAVSTRNGRARFVLLIPSESTRPVSRSVASMPSSPPSLTLMMGAPFATKHDPAAATDFLQSA